MYTKEKWDWIEEQFEYEGFPDFYKSQNWYSLKGMQKCFKKLSKWGTDAKENQRGYPVIDVLKKLLLKVKGSKFYNLYDIRWWTPNNFVKANIATIATVGPQSKEEKTADMVESKVAFSVDGLLFIVFNTTRFPAISKKFIKEDSYKASVNKIIFERVFAHEFAHTIAGENDLHGEIFKKAIILLGYDPVEHIQKRYWFFKKKFYT